MTFIYQQCVTKCHQVQWVYKHLQSLAHLRFLRHIQMWNHLVSKSESETQDGANHELNNFLGNASTIPSILMYSQRLGQVQGCQYVDRHLLVDGIVSVGHSHGVKERHLGDAASKTLGSWQLLLHSPHVFMEGGRNRDFVFYQKLEKMTFILLFH